MSAPQVSTIIKTVTRRAWSDIEPKVLTFAATGLSADVVMRTVDYFGFHIDPGLAMVISTCVASIAGYLKKSTAKTEIPAPAPVAAAPAPVVQAPAA